jgi:hypothetical protein
LVIWARATIIENMPDELKDSERQEAGRRGAEAKKKLITSLAQLPVYSINKPKPESLFVLKILSEVKGGKLKKSKFIEQLEEAGLIDKDLTIAAKHSKLKGLLNPISIAGGLDNPLVEVEYRGRQSNVILTSQGESTLKIFG